MSFLILSNRGEQPETRIYSAHRALTGSPKREDSFRGEVGDVPLSKVVGGKA